MTQYKQKFVCTSLKRIMTKGLSANSDKTVGLIDFGLEYILPIMLS